MKGFPDIGGAVCKAEAVKTGYLDGRPQVRVENILDVPVEISTTRLNNKVKDVFKESNPYGFTDEVLASYRKPVIGKIVFSPNYKHGQGGLVGNPKMNENMKHVKITKGGDVDLSNQTLESIRAELENAKSKINNVPFTNEELYEILRNWRGTLKPRTAHGDIPKMTIPNPPKAYILPNTRKDPAFSDPLSSSDDSPTTFTGEEAFNIAFDHVETILDEVSHLMTAIITDSDQRTAIQELINDIVDRRTEDMAEDFDIYFANE